MFINPFNCGQKAHKSIGVGGDNRTANKIINCFAFRLESGTLYSCLLSNKKESKARKTYFNNFPKRRLVKFLIASGIEVEDALQAVRRLSSNEWPYLGSFNSLY